MRTFLFSKNDILSGVAKWSVAQSPYHRPENLEKVLDALDRILEPLFEEAVKENLGYLKMSYEQIKDFVFNHATSITEVMEWNEPKIDSGNPLQGTASRYHQPKPDYDFIDLHALARNVANDIIWEVDGAKEPIPNLVRQPDAVS